MPPLDRRRRRRPLGQALWIALLVGLVLFLLIGGALRVGRASGPYTVDIDRSYALQAGVLAGQSNQQAAQLNRLVNTMPGLARRTLQTQLDELVAQATATATGAEALAPPDPAPGLDPGFTTAMADRAGALSDVRRAVYGLLGMTPQPVTGALGSPGPAAAGTRGATATLLPSDQAAAELTRAGAQLARADQTYAAVRRSFAAAPGHARLPASVWVHDPALWAPGTVETLVNDLTGSPTLATFHRLQLVTVRVSPAAVPPVGAPPAGPPGAAGACQATTVSVIPPTARLALDAVVANFGNVGETGSTVTAQLQPQGPGDPATSSARFALAPNTSAAIALPPLAIAPGDTYGLSVSVSAPPGQSDQTGLTGCYSIRVAPPTPTTTTTAPATTTSGAPGATTTTSAKPPG